MAVMFPRDITIRSKSTSNYDDDGNWIAAANTPTVIKGDAQPLLGEEVEALEIGRRELGKIELFTDSVLNVLDEETKQNGDVIEYDDGNDYEIIGVDRHRSGILDNTRYIAELRKGEIRSV